MKRRKSPPRMALLWCFLLASVGAFSRVDTHQSTRIKQQRLYSITIPDPPPSSFDKIEHESNFWHSTVRKDGSSNNKYDEDDSTRVPCDPSLDIEGPLPSGAYQILGKAENEPKPTCRLSIAVDTSTSDDPDVSRLHRFIDSGLSTFQLQKNTEWVYRKLQADTPKTLLSCCQFILPFQTPSTSIMAQPAVVRGNVLEALKRTGQESIDTLQLEYTKGSQYHLDVLDVLSELQREGLLRSIATKKFPPDLLRKAVSCGFSIDTNAISCNLLDPTRYTKELRLACQDLNIQLIIGDPLANDMLTSKFSNTQYEPPPWELTPKERNSLGKVVAPWAEKHSKDDHRWRTYQTTMMDTLDHIALKHSVSVSSVSLRWAMQLEHVASVVVPCGLGEMSDDRPFDLPQKLRQVFRFELDQDDMERLWQATGESDIVKKPEYNPVAGLDAMDIEGMEEADDDSFFLPDLSDSRLWL